METDFSGILNVLNTPEANQFIYLTNLLGINKATSGFNDLLDKIEKLKSFNHKEVSRDRFVQNIAPLCIVATVLFLALTKVDILVDLAGLLLILGLPLIYVYFFFNPYRNSAKPQKTLAQIRNSIQSFKTFVSQIIIENLEP